VKFFETGKVPVANSDTLEMFAFMDAAQRSKEAGGKADAGSVRDTETMVKSVEGIYRNGKVELVEPLTEAEGSRVIVTWIDPSTEPVDLRERGIDNGQAADLRHRLAAFAEDWDRPEMAVYDDLPPR